MRHWPSRLPSCSFSSLGTVCAPRWRAACSSPSQLPCLSIPDGSSPKPASTALFAIAALLLFASGKEIPVSRAVLASLLLGFSIHVRPANMVTVFVFIAATVLLERPKQTKASDTARRQSWLVVVGISGALYLARNYAFFGNPFDFGVPTTAENAKDLDSWRNPFWIGVFGFLFSPGKSVFLFSPPIILGILGLPRLWRRNRALALLAAAAPVANLDSLFLPHPMGGQLLLRSALPASQPHLALLSDCRFVAEPPEQPPWLRPLFWITAISGFLVQAIGLSTNILEDMVRNHYYIGNWDYRMSYSPITGQLQLIWKYLHVEPTAVGLGWDRWFVLLRAAGASPSLMTGITSLMLAGALIFGLLTWRAVRRRHPDAALLIADIRCDSGSAKRVTSDPWRPRPPWQRRTSPSDRCVRQGCRGSFHPPESARG